MLFLYQEEYMRNYLPACKIVSTHGVRGEMKALPLCDLSLIHI